MDLTGDSEVLAQATRARIFTELVGSRAALGTEELAGRLGLHPNGVRRHLERLHGAGLVERRRNRDGRGRPGDRWSVAASAHPRGERPTGYGDLSRWLARATPTARKRVREVEETGRAIGRELAPATRDEDPVEAFRQAISALGFQPRLKVGGGGFVCRLENCPYRDSARENPEIVCGMHRGITAGLLAELDPNAELERFEPHDPDRAGCVVEVAKRGSA